MSKITLLPKLSTLHKGQSANLSIEQTQIIPVNAVKDKNTYDELVKKATDLKYVKATGDEEKIKTAMDEISKLKAKLNIDRAEDIKEYKTKMKSLASMKSTMGEDWTKKTKEEIRQLKEKLGISEDGLIPVIEEKKESDSYKFDVINWSMKPATSGTLTPQGFKAKYMAPKIIPASNNTIIVTVKLMATGKSGKRKPVKLTARIDLIDEGYLNYSVDGKETKTLQFAWSSAYQKLAKEEGDKVAERTTAQCFYSKEENELSIGTVVMMNFLDKQILISLSVKNPGKGQNLLNCKDNGGISVTFGAKSLGILNDPCTNTETERYKNGKDCETKEICKTFELTLTEFDGEDGGTVAGNFTGTVYEDNDLLAKACESTKSHFVSGDFSLIIKTDEEGKKYESLSNDKPSKEKTSPEYDTPSTSPGTKPSTPSPQTKPTTKPATKPTTKPQKVKTSK